MLQRHRLSSLGRWTFLASTIVGIVVLSALLVNVIDQAFGLVAIEAQVEPASLAVDGVRLEDLSQDQLTAILQAHVSKGLLRRLENDQPLADRSREEVYELVIDRVVEPTIVETWSLTDSLLHRRAIEARGRRGPPGRDARVPGVGQSGICWRVRSRATRCWQAFAGRSLDRCGSSAMTVLLAFPIGIGAAIYLEEYAADTWVNRIIQTNINNLAGVPSIIYGILGLAIFVRALEPLTSGALLGQVADPTSANGRTILSAGLTLALLVLPLVIINAQEAIRAVPAIAAPGGVRPGRHKVADGLASRAAQRHRRDPDRHDPGCLARHGRDRAAGRRGGFHVHHLRSHRHLFQVHRLADSDLPVDGAAPGRVPQSGGGGHPGSLVLLLSLNAAAILLRNRYGRQGRYL